MLLWNFFFLIHLNSCYFLNKLSCFNFWNVLQKRLCHLQFSESYGPIMTVGLGPQRTVVLVGYEVVKDALVDHADDFLGRGPLPFLMKITRGYGSILHLYSRGSIKMSLRLAHVIPPFLLSGVAISNGERWRQLRRFTLSTLRDFGMGRKGMEAWIQEESKHLVARMDTTKGLVVTPDSYFCRRWSFKGRR